MQVDRSIARVSIRFYADFIPSNLTLNPKSLLGAIHYTEIF